MDLGLDKLDPTLERFAKLPKAYRLAVVPAAVLVLGAVYYFLLFEPTRTQLDRLEAQRHQLTRKLNEARSAAANVEPFERELRRLEEQLTAALRRLPNSKELPVLLVDISTLGKDAGLEVTEFTPQTEKQLGFYAEVPIQLEFSGRYHDIARFFDRVSKLPRIVNVGNLQMSTKAAASETILSVTGTATTFRFIESD